MPFLYVPSAGRCTGARTCCRRTGRAGPRGWPFGCRCSELHVLVDRHGDAVHRVDDLAEAAEVDDRAGVELLDPGELVTVLASRFETLAGVRACRLRDRAAVRHRRVDLRLAALEPGLVERGDVHVRSRGMEKTYASLMSLGMCATMIESDRGACSRRAGRCRPTGCSAGP